MEKLKKSRLKIFTKAIRYAEKSLLTRETLTQLVDLLDDKQDESVITVLKLIKAYLPVLLRTNDKMGNLVRAISCQSFCI